jgi:hypothetical protein
VRVRIGSEELTQEFQPLFSASEMLTVRLPLPLDLRAAPYAGTLRIIEDAYSLLRGDVIRACSSIKMGGQPVRISSMVLLVTYAFYYKNVLSIIIYHHMPRERRCLRHSGAQQ